MATLNSLSPGFSDTTNLTCLHSHFLSSFPYYKGDGKNKTNQLHVKKVNIPEE